MMNYLIEDLRSTCVTSSSNNSGVWILALLSSGWLCFAAAVGKVYLESRRRGVSSVCATVGFTVGVGEGRGDEAYGPGRGGGGGSQKLLRYLIAYSNAPSRRQ